MAIGEIPVAILFSAHVVIRNLSGERRVFTDVFEKSSHPTLHAGDDLHDEKKQGRAAVGKRDEKVRANADGEQD